jgi:hypothetical protein
MCFIRMLRNFTGGRSFCLFALLFNIIIRTEYHEIRLSHTQNSTIATILYARKEDADKQFHPSRLAYLDFKGKEHTLQCRYKRRRSLVDTGIVPLTVSIDPPTYETECGWILRSLNQNNCMATQLEPHHDTSQASSKMGVVILCFKTYEDYKNGIEVIRRMEESEIRIPSQKGNCGYQIKLTEHYHKKQRISLASSSDPTLSTGLRFCFIIGIIF